MSLGLNTGGRGGHPGPRQELQLAPVHVPGIAGRDVLGTPPKGIRPMPHVLVMTLDFLAKELLPDN